MKYNTVIIGGGPAGMMAAIQAIDKGSTLIIEKNKKLGKKLLITGKGRCNITTSLGINEIIDALGDNGKFFYGALTRFSNYDLMKFFEDRGLDLVEERGKRMFPKSQKAHDVLQTLESILRKKGIPIKYDSEVTEVISRESSVSDSDSSSKEQQSINENGFEIIINDNEKINANNLIIATGGVSYPATGSRGDGYEFAKSLGHKIIKPHSALVSMVVKDYQIRELAGLTLKNVELSFFRIPYDEGFDIKAANKHIASKFGDMLFTHRGISGPIVLDLSKTVGEEMSKHRREEIWVSIDLKPALSEEQLYRRINRDIKNNPKIYYGNLLKGLLPTSLIDIAVEKTGIEYDKEVSLMRREERQALLKFLKNFVFKVDELDVIYTAIVTAGGVELDEINPTTMESKLVDNLYFAGEVINLEGPTGGFNLQIAWSTGFVAGDNVAEE